MDSDVAIQLAARLHRAASADALQRAFGDAIERRGFAGFACGELDIRTSERSVLYLLRCGDSRPVLGREPWLTAEDAVFRVLGRAAEPVTLSALRREDPALVAGSRLLHALARSGWTEALFVPVVRTAVRFGIVAMVGARPAIGQAELVPLSVVAYALLDNARRLAPGHGADVPLARLSPRERDTLRLMVGGHSDRQIAELLGISVSTAREYVENARRKLQARNRAQAASLAVALGLVEP